MNRKSQYATLAAVLIAGGFAMNASATTVTGQFTVSLKVNATCAVTAGAASNIVLGPVLAGTATTVVGNSFTVNCSNKTPFTVGLAPSNANTAGLGNLTGVLVPAVTIAYQLYQNAAGTTIWGNTAAVGSAGNGESGTGAGMAAAKAITFNAYANATGSTDVTPDTYSDTVTINVNF